MEIENNIVEAQQVEVQKSPLHCVTPLSKYLAMVLFILMPFVGGWIGYTYAPEKVVEVEKIVIKDAPIKNGDEVVNVPTSADNAPEGSIHNLPVPAAVTAVKMQVATELDISAEIVIPVSVYEREWSDGCLGLGGPAESCIAVITPGYEITILAQGVERVYRTNVDGSSIREQK